MGAGIERTRLAAGRHGMMQGVVDSLSIAIPARNAGQTIVEQLDAIRAQDAEWLDEVVVVDSMSTDDTIAIVSTYATQWSKVRLASATLPGANTARNVGVANTSSAAVLLCDADDVVSPTWAATMFAALRQHDVVRGRYALELLNDDATISARGSLASTTAPSDSDPFGGLGGNCGFRRVVWDQLGGLLEHHYGSDDAEFFWRARIAGFDVAYEHDSVVNYRLRPGMKPLFQQQMQWASGRVLLYKEFHDAGLIQRRSAAAAAKAWAWLVIHLPDAASQDPQRRGRWIRGAAEAVGRVRGMRRHRVWFP